MKQTISIKVTKAFAENLAKCLEDSLKFILPYNQMAKNQIRKGIPLCFQQFLEILKKELQESTDRNIQLKASVKT